MRMKRIALANITTGTAFHNSVRRSRNIWALNDQCGAWRPRRCGAENAGSRTGTPHQRQDTGRSAGGPGRDHRTTGEEHRGMMSRAHGRTKANNGQPVLPFATPDVGSPLPQPIRRLLKRAELGMGSTSPGRPQTAPRRREFSGACRGGWKVGQPGRRR